MNQVIVFILFFIVVTLIFGSMQYRLYRVVRQWIVRAYAEPERRSRIRSARWITLLLNVLFTAQMVVRGTTFYDQSLIQTILIYPMGWFFAIVVLAFLIVTAYDVVRLVRWAVNRIVSLVSAGKMRSTTTLEPVSDPGRRRFLRLGGLSAASVVGAVPIIASARTARDYQVNRIALPFEDLPPGLDGFTIAHVSDIHSGIYMTERDMREIFEIVKSLDANTIMVTGDFVDSSDSQIEPLFKALEMLKAEYGIYGCLGNHDHFATAPKVSAAVEQRGIVMLNNSNTELPVNADRISIIGIDDAGRGGGNFADWKKALDGMNPDTFSIALTHRPEQWDQTRPLEIDLTLAGHTHGGQVGFRLGPLNLNPVYLVHKYPMGLYTQDNTHLYVNVGVGMVGVPIRMVRPEVALLTLRRGARDMSSTSVETEARERALLV